MEGLLKKNPSLFKVPYLEGSFNLQALDNTARFLTGSGSQVSGVLAWRAHDSKQLRTGSLIAFLLSQTLRNVSLSI